MLERLCTHPNVGAVAAGVAGLRGVRPRHVSPTSSPPAAARSTTLVIQAPGGTRATVAAGRAWIAEAARPRCRAHGTPGAVRPRGRHHLRWLGRHERHHRRTPPSGGCSTRLVAAGGDGHLRGDGRAHRLRAPHGGRGPSPPSSASRSSASVAKAADYYTAMGHGSFAPGNAEGGLTTLEEKSLGAYAKSGHAADPRRRDSRGSVLPTPRALPARRGARGQVRAGASPTSTTTPRSPS